MKKRTTFIYALRDPRDNAVRYIGKSNAPKARLLQHLEDATTNAQKAAWICSLAELGLTPQLSILEEVDLSDWQQAERSWIALGFAEGWPLTNISPGGCGSVGNPYGSAWESTIANYLMPHERPLFAALPYKKQCAVCCNTALAMMNLSWYAIKQRGGNPEVEYNEHKQFWHGSRVARALVRKMAAK